MLQSVIEYYRVLQSVRKCYEVLQTITECYSVTEYCRVLQSITEYYRVLQRIAEYCRMLQSVRECCRALQCITKYYRVIQNITEYYRVFLAHLLGPISGLVCHWQGSQVNFLMFRLQVMKESWFEEGSVFSSMVFSPSPWHSLQKGFWSFTFPPFHLQL